MVKKARPRTTNWITWCRLEDGGHPWTCAICGAAAPGEPNAGERTASKIRSTRHLRRSLEPRYRPPPAASDWTQLRATLAMVELVDEPAPEPEP